MWGFPGPRNRPDFKNAPPKTWPDFGAFPVAVRSESGPVGRFTARKHYCVTIYVPEALLPVGTGLGAKFGRRPAKNKKHIIICILLADGVCWTELLIQSSFYFVSTGA
jgi:hypothetical protein